MSPLLKLMRTMELFQSHREQIKLQHIEAFLLVAMRKRVTRQELVEAVGMHLSSAGRNMRALCQRAYELNGTTYMGLGLLNEEPDPIDSRRFVYTLTHKGQRIADQISAILGSAAVVTGAGLL